MSARARAFERMRAGSIEGVLGTGTRIYGVDIDTMTESELRIALGWSLSQNARLAPEQVDVMKGLV